MWLVSETGIIVILRGNCPIVWSGRDPSGGALKLGGGIALLPHAGYGPVENLCLRASFIEK